MKRKLFYRNRSMGIVGESTGVYPKCGDDTDVTLKVGDLVSFYRHERIYTKVVVKSPSRGEEGKYGIFGFGANTLTFDKLTRVCGHEDLTEDIFQKTQELDAGAEREMYTIRDVVEKEMTIEQIQEELGYPIKIVGSETDE